MSSSFVYFFNVMWVGVCPDVRCSRQVHRLAKTMIWLGADAQRLTASFLDCVLLTGVEMPIIKCTPMLMSLAPVEERYAKAQRVRQPLTQLRPGARLGITGYSGLHGLPYRPESREC